MSASLLRRFVFLVACVAFPLLPAFAGTFKNPELIATSYDPQGIGSGDFNHDGIPDLAYVDGSNPSTLHILLGKGNGTFSHGQDIDLPQAAGPNSVINVADVTNDGISDIVIGGGTSNQGKIIVLTGNGDGSFQSPIISTVTHAGSNGGSPYLNAVMGIGDVNGDGAADLVIADATSATLYVLLGDNKGDFAIGNTITFYFTGESDTYLFDLNGDGHLDVVVNNLLGAQTIVWLGNGNGTLQAGVSYASYAVAFADMDGDGRPDLVGEIYPGQVQVLKGNPDGTFGSPAAVTTVPAGDFLLAAGDFNGDGIADMLFITPAGIGVVLGKGNLTYGSIVSSIAGTLASSYLLGSVERDFNGDGHLDVAMAVSGGLLVLQGNGDGTFASGDSYDVGHTVGAVAVADFNGDQLPDIAASVSATYPRLLLGNGAGQFTLGPDQNQSYGSQPPSGSVTAADFNGDKKNDLYMLEDTQAYPFGQPFILLGAGNGTFASPTSVASGPTLIGDLNGDGRSDMVTLSNGSIVAMLGQTNGTFQQVLTALTEPTSGTAALGDVNHDGKLDLLTFEYPAIRVWLGDGNGSFTQSSLLNAPPEQLNFQSAAVADLDGDGKADIVVVSYRNQIGAPYPLLIYYGNGDGTFQDGVLLPTSHSYTQLVLADINGDNRPDFILSDGNGIAVIPNLGGRNFGAEEHYVAGREISGLTVADVNGDGFPDIIAANAGGTTVAVLLNQPTGNPIDGAPSNGLLTASPEPSQYGQPVSLHITMSAPSGPVPTGSVSFNVDGSFIATTKLVSGQATRTFGGVLNTGTHTFVATYNGDQTYAPASFAVLHTVTPPIYATSTVLVANPITVFTSQTITLSATVSSSVQVPNGVFTFFDGTKTLGAKAMVSYGSQTVVFDTNLLDAGTHALTAVYHGWQDPFNQQAIYQPSTSAPVTVAVNATPTTTSVSASSQQIAAGTVVTFTSNVASNSGTPFGGVTFYDGTAMLGTSSLKADGSCTFSTASLSVGTHNIVARYNANATFAASTSPAVVVTVTAAAAGLVHTITALAITDRGDGLRASVLTVGGDVPSGEVIFIDNGDILGTGRTDATGTAILPMSQFAAGTHHLYASFSGTSPYAPSASPALLEQFPSGTPGFTLSVSGNSILLTRGASDSIVLTVVPGAGFRQLVQLACVNGVPAGYKCSFSPSSLHSGSSKLVIRPLTHTAKRAGRSNGFHLSFLIIVSSILIGVANRRNVRFLLVLLVLAMTACGNPSTSAEPQMMVLSIQATAGSGTSAVIHSAQVDLTVRN